MKKENIPNVLSIIRILLIFIFVFFVFYNFPNFRLAAAGIYLLAGATDVLDGYLARRFGWTSDAGKILDPLADKLFQTTVLVCLAIKKLLPVWLIIPFILKELIQITLALLLIKRRGVIAHSNRYGKAGAVILSAAGLFVLVSADRAEEFRNYINVIYIIIMLFMTIVMALYIARYLNAGSEADNIMPAKAEKNRINR